MRAALAASYINPAVTLQRAYTWLADASGALRHLYSNRVDASVRLLEQVTTPPRPQPPGLQLFDLAANDSDSVLSQDSLSSCCAAANEGACIEPPLGKVLAKRFAELVFQLRFFL